ncbi:MAG: nucleotidyltransferase domain-containing protein [Deltaproteobacteria bacterium]|nr:nucleotidyltransferase domain-containing protein [Deltaproteobacteria bacterium]
MENALIEKIQSYFSSKNEVVAVYLFGSHAQGKARRTSDVDIGILLNSNDPDLFKEKQIRYLKELGRLLRKDIHPVILNTAGEMLMQQIFTKGKCIVDNEHRKHSEFRMVMFSRIAAFSDYKKQMQAGLIKNIMGGPTVGL